MVDAARRLSWDTKKGEKRWQGRRLAALPSLLGASIYDVRIFFGIFLPPSPPCMQLGLLYGAELNPCNLPHNVTFWSNPLSVDIINGSIPYVYATIFYLLGTQG